MDVYADLLDQIEVRATGAPESLGTSDLSIDTAAVFYPTGVTLPTGKTWAYISMGAHTENVNRGGWKLCAWTVAQALNHRPARTSGRDPGNCSKHV